MGNEYIKINGARQNNLKNINVLIPREKLVVLTGLSGSGKSSLAFDTIFAEGQRRYMESLSSYARQFLGQANKPDVDYIEGLSPAISIDQKTTSKNPRSTVGTVTEIYDYLRLLYARIGIQHCPSCGRVVSKQSIDQIVDQVLELEAGTKILVMAPVVKGKKGEHKKVLSDAKKNGYVRAIIDGEQRELSEDIELPKTFKHTISIIVDRLIIKEGLEKRLTESLETAFNLTGGTIEIQILNGETLNFSKNFSCPDCGISMSELVPRNFSFNAPYGACPHCDGIGYHTSIDENLIIDNENKSVLDGALYAPGWNSVQNKESFAYMYFTALGEHYGFDPSVPWCELSDEAKKLILYGTNGEKIRIKYARVYGGGTVLAPFEGVINNLERRSSDSKADPFRLDYDRILIQTKCPECNGARLNKEMLAVTVGNKNIFEFTNLNVSSAIEYLNDLKLTPRQEFIAHQIIKEILARLSFLNNVGLNYLTLSRASGTLSGGEAQRIRLATQIGSGLMGVLYILDEPSIGLHQRDNNRLISTLKNLRDLGNTVIVVEHDTDTMKAADYIVDIGPGAGVNGGYVVGEGTAKELESCPKSLTGKYLSGELYIDVPKNRRKPIGFIEIKGASHNNLKNVNVKIPLGVFTCVTGVSGSGKSTLINEILHKFLARKLNRAHTTPGKFKEIIGYEQLDKIIEIDQSPIGRTPRSNPATYTNLFNDIRELFASTNDAKIRGFKPGRFSFNVSGGRCESCQGDGIIKIEMHFLSDVYVPCDVCKGQRYNRETLEVRYKGKNIYDVLDMTVDEALMFFENIPKIKRKLDTLHEVGLGYIKLGQSSTTISGGEAQRVKLAAELAKRGTGKTIYILDEPTTGLHIDDVKRLCMVLQRLVDAGNSVLIIEHNMDMIKTADYIIDLGPEGGDGGGQIIAQGTPEKIANTKDSYTGQFLKEYL